MPCDAAAVCYKVKPGGRDRIVTEAGDVIACEVVDEPAGATGWGYIPHWGTCKAPDKFRRRARR